LTSIKFDKDEIFEPNPYGIKGQFLTNVTIPKGTVIQIPYDEPVNGGPGKYFLGEGSDQVSLCSLAPFSPLSPLSPCIYIYIYIYIYV
jgi:hypothetical protein